MMLLLLIAGSWMVVLLLDVSYRDSHGPKAIQGLGRKFLNSNRKTLAAQA